MWPISKALLCIARDLGLEHETPLPDSGPTLVFDIRSLPCKKFRGKKADRVLPASTIVVHITDVPGGFGVSPRRVAFWSKAIATGLVPQDIADQLAGLAHENNARRLALWERYRNTPYHFIAGCNGDAIVNHGLERYTYHAGKGNHGIGWALDIGRGEPVFSRIAEAGRRSLREACNRVRANLDAAGLATTIEIVPHRAFSMMRLADPGGDVWRTIVQPVIEQRGDVVGGYGIRDGGLPIPRSWDRAATFDDRGNPVR